MKAIVKTTAVVDKHVSAPQGSRSRKKRARGSFACVITAPAMPKANKARNGAPQQPNASAARSTIDAATQTNLELFRTLAQHARIAIAIRDGLPDEADRLLRLHVLDTGAELARLMSMVSAVEGHNGAAGEALYAEPLPPLQGLLVK